MGFVGRPDGGNPRHYRGGAGSLGSIAVWDCPACGKRNDARQPEQGCVHCGAGDPRLSTVHRPEPRTASSSVEGAATPRPANDSPRRTEAVRSSVPEGVRILRLIEYVVRRPEMVQQTLRNSLVGTLEMGWGTLTATIVDTIDTNQEDRLRLAKMQPGVWLANPEAVAQQDRTAAHMMRPLVEARAAALVPAALVPAREFVREVRQMEREIPDTGPAFSPEQHALAVALVEMAGYKVVYTLALALQTVAPELEANMEPERFLSMEECLQLANALMQQIPVDWTPGADVQPPAPPSREEEEQARQDARLRIQAVQQGSKPAATPWQDPSTLKGGGVLDG